jgi:two-component system chemotaxis sensor kinase CheA
VQKQRGNGHITADMTVRTSVERLDILMNLVGELITDRNHLLQIRNRMEAEARGDGDVDKLSETVTHLGRITDQLQEEVMRIRMLPISNVMHKFPRLVRDLAQKTGKLIDLVIQGEDTELDRSMIEEINDPLIHLVRNSVDHGIESSEVRIAAGKPERGTITIAARHEQGRIVLTVEDDGRGIDPEVVKKAAVHKGLISPEEAAMLTEEQAINLVFLPGFSTAEKVTDISGRGIGMDIVQTNIQRVNGVIAVDTHLGQGTQFQIVLPLTLAIVRTLLVEVGKSTYAIPLVMVTETLRLQDSDIKTIGGKPVTVLRGKTLPLIHMAEVFDLPTNESSSKYPFAVVVHSGKQRVGLVVDSFCGEEEVVVKSIGALVGNVPGISSAAILGDGRVTLIVDVMGLFKLTGIH